MYLIFYSEIYVAQGCVVFLFFIHFSKLCPLTTIKKRIKPKVEGEKTVL